MRYSLLMKITYTSEDGTTFSQEEDCLAYEKQVDSVKAIYQYNVM